MKNVILSEFPITTIQSDETTMDSVLVVAIDTDDAAPGKIVGAVKVIEGAAVKNPSACIHDLCVDVRYRRRGIGRALTIRAIDIARRRWPASELAWLMTSKDNREAIALYGALGFVETGPYKANGIYMAKSIKTACTQDKPKDLQPNPAEALEPSALLNWAFALGFVISEVA